jgi:hypothetical protein
VRITGYLSGGLKTAKLHLQGVTVVRTYIGNSPPAPLTGVGAPMIWVDGCAFTNNARDNDTRWVSTGNWPGGIYATNCDIDLALYGWVGVQLARNTTVRRIGADAFNNCQMVINAEVDDIAAPPGMNLHPDVVQLNASAVPFDNVIVYGLRATNCRSQGLFVGYTGHIAGPAWSNLAFVNVVMSTAWTSQWTVNARHVLFWHMSLPTSYLYVRDKPAASSSPASPTTVTDFSLTGCVLAKFFMIATGGYPNMRDQRWASNNHFIDTDDGQVVGASATRGGTLWQLFQNPVASDFRARRYSAIDRRTNGLLVPVDALNLPRGAGASIGALQPGLSN